MKKSKHQPVIIGVGELCEPLPHNLKSASSLVDLLADAARAACADSGAPETAVAGIDTIAMVRTFADSIPRYVNPFGNVENYPRALAKRIGADPVRAVYGVMGGDTPQALISEFADRIATGEAESVLVVGGEAMATTRAAIKSQVVLDWSDGTDGQLEDRGARLESITNSQQIDNRFHGAPLLYGLLETARRHERGQSRAAYAQQMGEIFARFSKVAANHPVAMFPHAYCAEELVQVGPANPMIAEPYPRHLVAKDGVNQAAAVLMTSLEHAERLGIARDRMTFPQAAANTSDVAIVERPRLGESLAMRLAYQSVFEQLSLSPDAIRIMDLYSCFPIAVFEACDAMGIGSDDPRDLTVTGGLPFFGGAGNSYSMHSVVNVVKALRQSDEERALVGANGGALHKHSVCIYGKNPAVSGWNTGNDEALQRRIDAQSKPAIVAGYHGPATIEAYTVNYRKGAPTRGYIAARTPRGERFLAHSDAADRETVQTMIEDDVIGRTIHVTSIGVGSLFTFNSDYTSTLEKGIKNELR